VILVIGSAVGFLGAATPTSNAYQQNISLIDTSISVAPNNYAAQSLQMTKNETIRIHLSVDNQSMFTFDIMNQSQFYLFNNCAPKCEQPLLGGQGSYYQQDAEATPTQLNVTISPSTAYSEPFMAPSNGTYYFVFDNSIGPTWSNYLNQNATGHLDGHFALTSIQLGTNYLVNWVLVGAGAMFTVIGGVIATVLWKPTDKQSSTK